VILLTKLKIFCPNWNFC